MKSNNNIKYAKLVFFAFFGVLMLASCSSKQEKIKISDAVKINFDSVFNVMLNDTFYFPKIFGNVNLLFQEKQNGYEMRYEMKICRFRERIWLLRNYLSYTKYYGYSLSDKQLRSFRDYHDDHFGDPINMGERSECLDSPIEVNFSLPLIYTKYNGDWFMVFDYLFSNASTETNIKFKSYADLYPNYESSGTGLRFHTFQDNTIYCEGITLKCPIIFKWDKQKQIWQLRNTKEMFEADIEELGFHRPWIDIMESDIISD